MLNDIIELPVAEKLPPNSQLTLNLAVDVGSTETRSICFDMSGEETMQPVEVEPSTFAKLDYNCDISDIKSIHPKLMDNFEVRLRTLAEEKFTILKGTLAQQIGAEKRSSSAKSKMEQDSTLVNIHSACIMNILKIMNDCEFDLGTDVIANINLTLALPPEDTDPVRVEKLKAQFEGVYEAYMPRIGRKFAYCILPDNVTIVSECNATAYYYMCMMCEDEFVDDNVIVLECGGRSSSAAVVKEGILVTRAHRNFDIGGTNLVQILIDCLAEQTGSTKVSMSVAEKALCSGFIRKGATKVSVCDTINKAKEIFAKKLVDKILEAIEGAELSADSIQRIVVSGRIFGELTDPKNGVILSPSLGSYVRKVYQSKWCSDTDIIRISTTYPIPEGLVLYSIGTR